MSRGLTLVEVLVTLVIVAIAAGVAVPAFARLGETQPEREAATAFANLVERARRTAVERATRVTLIVDPARERYWAWADSAGSRAALDSGTLDLPSDADVPSKSPRIALTFDRYGAATGDTVLVRSPEGAWSVAPDPWTGVARAHRQ